MMNIKVWLLALCCCSTGIQAHDFESIAGSVVVASYDITGEEIWENFFLSDGVLLVEPSADHVGGYKYINHPPYIEKDIPMHKLICAQENSSGSGAIRPCKDTFPHVHFDDFQMALIVGEMRCKSYGSGVIPDFLHPSTFVTAGATKMPANSHHFHYNLSQGLKFDCVAAAVQ